MVNASKSIITCFHCKWKIDIWCNLAQTLKIRWWAKKKERYSVLKIHSISLNWSWPWGGRGKTRNPHPMRMSCEDRESNFIQCLHCIDTFFCSKRCSMNQIHRLKCKSIIDKNDCHIVRLVYEIIAVAFKSIENTEELVSYCNDVFLSNKIPQCSPALFRYG